MSLLKAKCTNCGANLEVDNSKEAAICPYCQTAYIVEKAINNYSITNNIKTDQVNIFYGSDSEDNKIQREFDKIDGYIKIDDFDSAHSTLEDLSNTYPGNFDVWNKFLDFLYICADNGYSIGRPFIKTLKCINKLCPEDRKEEVQKKIDNKSEEICKKIESGDLSLMSFCSAIDFWKGFGLLNEKYSSMSMARQRWDALLKEFEYCGIAYNGLIEYCESILDMLSTLHVGFDFKSKIFCAEEYATDEILLVIGKDLITLHIVSGSEVYLNRYRININASSGDYFCNYVKDSKKLYKARYDKKVLEGRIEKLNQEINNLNSQKNMNVIDAMKNSKEKSRCKKELDELNEQRYSLIGSINVLVNNLK